MVQFRMVLPTTLTVVTALFGAVGLLQRSAILDRPWLGNQTLWDTTARFHVWPWPYKFAAILNLPALLGGLLFSLPLSALRPDLPEIAQVAPSLVLVPPLWFWVGTRLDRRFNAEQMPERRLAWVLFVVFVLVCLAGSLFDLGYIGYLYYGMAVWITAAVLLGTLRRHQTR